MDCREPNHVSQLPVWLKQVFGLTGSEVPGALDVSRIIPVVDVLQVSLRRESGELLAVTAATALPSRAANSATIQNRSGSAEAVVVSLNGSALGGIELLPGQSLELEGVLENLSQVVINPATVGPVDIGWMVF
jgi:hypothetical protein